MNNQISRSFTESLEVKQGHIKSSDNYKIYINPLLDAIDGANLGVWIGPVNVGSAACADDEYIMTDRPTKLQALLDIASFYGSMYRSTYGADKTKVTVIGSNTDMEYYKETAPWHLNGAKLKVTENNEHLGQIISGHKQEEKNVELRISKGRSCLFSLLGPAFANKCLLSPNVKIHLFRTFVCPIIRSGLASFSLRMPALEPLAMFQRKSLRGVLSLSKTSAIPALHFLLGELPVAAKVHRDIFSLFYSVWTNPQTKIFEIVKHLLETSEENSRTWSVHLRHLCRHYGLPDPLDWLRQDPPLKSTFKESVITKICAKHENELRLKAKQNSKLTYMNVSLLGLRGRLHPVLNGIVTPDEVKKCRIHLKMLIGDYLTYETKSAQSGGSPYCRCCSMSPPHIETIEHILTQCSAYSNIRERIFEEFTVACEASESRLKFNSLLSNASTLCQFILDPTSFNLTSRIHFDDAGLQNILKISRDFCFATNKERLKILKQYITT